MCFLHGTRMLSLWSYRSSLPHSDATKSREFVLPASLRERRDNSIRDSNRTEICIVGETNGLASCWECEIGRIQRCRADVVRETSSEIKNKTSGMRCLDARYFHVFVRAWILAHEGIRSRSSRLTIIHIVVSNAARFHSTKVPRVSPRGLGLCGPSLTFSREKPSHASNYCRNVR